MSDFVDSLRILHEERIQADPVLGFVLELLERAENSHSETDVEVESFYFQGRKDVARSIAAFILNDDFDMASASSVVHYKLRGDLPLDDGTVLERKK